MVGWTSIENPANLEFEGGIVVLGNGRVTRVMKIFEVHLFAFAAGHVTLHVRL